MDFRVLGPFEVWDRDTQIEIGGSKQRAVLALLVLHANEVVGSDRLIDELWGGSAPQNAAASLRNHVSRLRKVLGPDVVATRAWGYVLRADPGQVDIDRFESLVRDAEPMPAKERAAELADALAIWRGPALADIAFEPALAKDIARLEELRVAVVEARIDADLETGRNADLIGELEGLIAEHPLRERLRGQLILALYRSGRQAEALEVYRETRRLLADELGLEPGPELRELERAILRQDPSLAPGAPPPGELADDVPLKQRRWLAYAALASVGLLTAVGLATFAVIRTNGTTAHSVSLMAATSDRATTGSGSNQTKPDSSSTLASSGSAETKTAPTKPKRVTHRHRSPSRRATPRHPTSAALTAPANPTSHSSPGARRQTPGVHATAHPAPASKEFRLADDFSGDSMNSLTWMSGTVGTGVEVAQRNGRLEMTMHADATPDTHWNAIDGYYVTRCSFAGNFDARIDYALVNWPNASGVVIAIDVTFPANVVNIVRGSQTSGEDDYTFSAPSGETRSIQTTDTTGGLRMVRVGDVITAYIRSGTHWLRFASGHHAGPVRIRPILWASGSDFAHKDVTVDFDNFLVEAPSDPCL